MKCASLQASHGNTIDTPEDAKNLALAIIYLRQSAIARDVCLSVCLSVSKITQKRVRGFR